MHSFAHSLVCHKFVHHSQYDISPWFLPITPIFVRNAWHDTTGLCEAVNEQSPKACICVWDAMWRQLSLVAAIVSDSDCHFISMATSSGLPTPTHSPLSLYYRRNTLNTHAFTHTPLTTRPHTHFRPNCAQFTTLLLASYSHIAIFLPANSNSSSAHWLHDICLACVPIVPVVRLANCARIVVWMCVFHAPLAAHTVSGSVTINQWIKIK